MCERTSKGKASQKEIVIPKEEAVFWMDKNGNWVNESGRFKKPKIIRHFNASIGKDKDGYFVTQDIGDRWEKVYFFYEDTVLFVVDIKLGDTVLLLLNTGEKKILEPENLSISNDSLYMDVGNGDRIKFSERSLIKLSPLMIFEDDRYFIQIGKQRFLINNLEI